jgi:hypothetical protein
LISIWQADIGTQIKRNYKTDVINTYVDLKRKTVISVKSSVVKIRVGAINIYVATINIHKKNNINGL